MSCNVPVMICGFKRDNCLRQVFKAVRAVEPKKLYLVLDAPRVGRADDVKGHEACKKIFEGVDWQCEVKRNYAESNMGCGRRMTSGISWVFEHEDRAIILEDDCVPHPSFFRFCDELLERYKDDGRVGMIAAECEHFHKNRMDFHGDSYYFDRMCLVWGWATWARAWKLHDPLLNAVDRMVETNAMLNIFHKRRYVRQWTKNIMEIKSGQKNIWAAAWATTLYRENMLVAHSVANPVVNIGQGKSSREGMRQTAFPSPGDSNHIAEEISFPLQHPVTMIPNYECEQLCLRDTLYRSPWRKMLSNPCLAIRRFWEKFCG